MRPRLTVLAALATGIGIFLAGCGQQTPTVPEARQGGASGASDQDPVATWADGYCGAVSHLVRTLATLPTVDPSTPQRASRTSSELLSSVVSGLDETLSGLHRLGPAPLAAGDASRLEVVTKFSAIRDRADQVRSHLDAASADAGAIKAALGEARASLDELSSVDLLNGLKKVPALAAASQRASGCQELTAAPAPRPR
ncbi:hypothetical protein [Amycolatopsis sp. H20-H5]|uniref:hypothetical protein n=1 Tax=Amycolatopsis sp. H20-H5 TaxID=3046309 RepID=UPI002DB922A1|nr:hypothetical protein [Amycolatopsis sp. H20-H5]MEC3979546.1 hypothetical protein [Amycolatopsis sp. H20-H5]